MAPSVSLTPDTLEATLEPCIKTKLMGPYDRGWYLERRLRKPTGRQSIVKCIRSAAVVFRGFQEQG